MIDPQSPSRLYAASSETIPYFSPPGVYRSTNGGTSWTYDGLSGSIRDLAISSTYPKTVFAAIENAVFKSVVDLVESPHVGDFNADGKSDLLRRSGDRDPVVSLMNGAVVQSTSFLPSATAEWFTSGVGDFDGDSKDDILWRSVTGDVGVWLMDGARVASFHNAGNAWTGWTIYGVGDFDGDRRADILWRSVSGDVAIWLMDGARIASFHTLGNVWTGWTISGVGDFDGDRHADILWQEDTGRVGIWRMDGSNVIGSGLIHE